MPAPFCTSRAMSAPELFDRRLRRLRRDRATPHFAEHAFLIHHMAEELVDRLAMVTRDFGRALVLGASDAHMIDRLRGRGTKVVAADPGFAFARAAGGVQCDEDRLPFADASFDLIISIGLLDSVNDLPGALALIRRALCPDGLFLGGFVGAGSLPRLRAAMSAADGDRAAPRLHPQIDVRSAGDLLVRAGFTMPVADGDRLNVRYRSLEGLLSDLRGMGATSALVDRGPPIGREALFRAFETFGEAADEDGRTAETFELVYLSGWSPDASQPKPARRGSATASLAEALKPKS